MKQHNLKTFVSKAFTNIPAIHSAKKAGKVLHKSSRLSRKQISVTCKRLPRQAFEQDAVGVIMSCFALAALHPYISAGRVAYASPFPSHLHHSSGERSWWLQGCREGHDLGFYSGIFLFSHCKSRRARQGSQGGARLCS